MDLSVREAAILLGRSVRTVRAQVARGEIPAKKVRGRWRIQQTRSHRHAYKRLQRRIAAQLATLSPRES